MSRLRIVRVLAFVPIERKGRKQKRKMLLVTEQDQSLYEVQILSIDFFPFYTNLRKYIRNNYNK